MTLLIQKSSNYTTAQPFLAGPVSKASEKLERIRSDILRSSGVVAQLPIQSSMYVLQLISDYAGQDKAQEAETELIVRDSLSDIRCFKYFEKLLDSSKVFSVFTKHIPSSMQEELQQAFLHTIDTLIRKNTFLGDMSIAEVEADPVKRLLLHGLFVEAGTQLVDSTSIKWALNQTFLQAITSEIQRQYGNKGVLLQKDREQLIPWIKKLNMLQDMSGLRQTVPSIKAGNCKGFTFAIIKNAKLYGYVYGTMHELIGLEKLLRITPKTQERLYECTILGTEERPDPELIDDLVQDSIDAILMGYAKQRGIAILGIDDELRDFGAEEEPLQIPVSLQLKWQKAMIDAEYTGNLKKMQETAIDMQKHCPLLKENTCLKKRNQTIADNIDTLLHACEKTGNNKCFFAIGSFHLISTPRARVSVVELLQKKGWTLALI